MSELIAKSNVIALVGMGITGRSVARYLTNLGTSFVWLDTRDEPPALEEIKREFPSAAIELGKLQPHTLLNASEIVLSPGVAASDPVIQQAIQQGISVIGDIELFLREAKAPVVAITGSNAKTTVTTLVGKMAESAGKRVAVGGNIGTPVLELLQHDCADLYVLELSSFQLETLNKIGADVATILNISEDHMDRYDSLMQYYQAKQKVYFGAKKIVINREDPLTAPPLAEGIQQYSFGLNRPDRHGFGLILLNGQEMLAYEFTTLMPVSDLRIPGRHNIKNALAALAIGHAIGLPMETMLEALRQFEGLPHRCQWVAECEGINYYNDSKGTNVGATLAAIKGFSAVQTEGDLNKIVLIAGGVGKGADFKPLATQNTHLRCVIVMGEDADKIAAAFADLCLVIKADSMLAAVRAAQQNAQAGDTVLLSPACASFDMFTGYEHRGESFSAIVREVTA